LPTVRSVVLSLGSNMGDSAAILQGAVDDLVATEGLEVTAVSAVFETDPVGGPEQKAFLNAVVLGRTSLRDHELLSAVQAVENHWHRTREVRWGPRTLDADVIAVDLDRSDDPRITIPHPLAHERGFVLVPWLDVDPEAVLAGHGRVDELMATVDCTGVRPSAVTLTVRGRHSEPGR
jgi:2-amino-4-hydroxy-6-hydroxymethyldihydropteridine diphosphokinase